MTTRRAPPLLIPLLLVLAGLSASAQATPAIPAADTPPPPGLSAARILPGWRAPDGSRIAALKVTLDPGWKTYWRVPGEAGIPPQIDFSESTNLGHVEVIWPTPTVFEQNGTRSVGYMDGMVLPLRITPADPALPVDLKATLAIGICHDICVPATVKLAAHLDQPGTPEPDITAAMQDVPAPRPGIARCTVTPNQDGMRVSAAITLPDAANQVALFELRSTPMWISQSTGSRDGDVFVSSVDFVPEDQQPFALDPSDLRITVISDAGAVQIDGCPAP